MLADPAIGFLSTDRKEWNADGKSYINGLFKMLRPDGSHPGPSNEDQCTFRLHIVLVTARVVPHLMMRQRAQRNQHVRFVLNLRICT